MCSFHSLWHPLSFVRVWSFFCYTSLLVVFVSLLLYHLLDFSTNSLPWLSLLWFYVDGPPLFWALSPSQYFLSALFPLLSLSSPVILPVYLLSNFNILCRWILFLVLLARAYCPVTCCNRPVFITQRPKVWARHWLFWRWEQNVMDFHLHS